MAKKNDAAYTAFLADLKDTVGADKWAAVEDALKDEKASAKLRDGVLARSEFSSQMDALTAERKSFESEVAEARSRIAGWQDWYGKSAAQQMQMEEKLKQYRNAYGDLETGQKPDFLTADEFQKRWDSETRTRDAAALKFADDLTDLKIEHRERFKEKLDTTGVLRIAGEKQVPLDVAYSYYIKDKEAALQKQELDSRIQQERSEAVKEYASKHNLPIIDSNPDVVHVLDVPQAPTTQRDRVAAAIASFGKR